MELFSDSTYCSVSESRFSCIYSQQIDNIMLLICWITDCWYKCQLLMDDCLGFGSTGLTLACFLIKHRLQLTILGYALADELMVAV